MKPQDVLDHYMTQEAAGNAAQASQSSVSRWFSTGEIPAHHQVMLVVDSGGKLKLDKATAALVRAQAELYEHAIKLSE